MMYWHFENNKKPFS